MNDQKGQAKVMSQMKSVDQKRLMSMIRSVKRVDGELVTNYQHQGMPYAVDPLKALLVKFVSFSELPKCAEQIWGQLIQESVFQCFWGVLKRHEQRY